MSYIVFPVCVIKSCQLCESYDFTYMVIKGPSLAKPGQAWPKARFICSCCKDHESYKDEPDEYDSLWNSDEILPRGGPTVSWFDVLQNLREQ